MTDVPFNIPVVRFDSRHLHPGNSRRYIIRLDREKHATVIDEFISTDFDDVFILHDEYADEFLMCMRSGPSVSSGVGARRATGTEVMDLGVLGR